MERETTGTVISAAKQLWLKVNTKPVRSYPLDGAAFPHIIKIKYEVAGREYICRKWVHAGSKIPDEGGTVKILYREDRPSKARAEI